jgi:hypothetical protein
MQGGVHRVPFDMSGVPGGINEEYRLVMVASIGRSNNQPCGSCNTGIKAELDIVEAAVSNRPRSGGKLPEPDWRDRIEQMPASICHKCWNKLR